MRKSYNDMVGLPHPVSRRHPPMARIKRAAQFAAFDALTGFGAAIAEAGRETEEKARRPVCDVSGNVKRLDGIKCAIIMADGKTIPMEDVRYLDGDLFRGYE